MEPELISASGRDMAGDFSGEAVVAGLLMRSGWTWRTILSVCPCGGDCCGGSRETGSLVTGRKFLQCPLSCAAQTGAGIVMECALVLGETQAAQ